MKTKQANVRHFPESQTAMTPMKKISTRVFGVVILGVSLSLFVQALPFMYIFLGAYIGVPTDASVSDMDTMVWLLTSATMMILALYVFVTWMKYAWYRFMMNPKPLFHRRRQ